MSRRFYLGIDQGTTGTAVLIFDEQWQVAARGYREHSQLITGDGQLEHDPFEIWEAVCAATASAMRKSGAAASEIACVGLANQGETCLTWEKSSGRPIYNAIVWQDRRTAHEADRIAETHGELIRKRTGLRPDAYFSATKLKWILSNVEGAKAKSDTGELAAGTLDSWLLFKMTGGRVHMTDYSTASRTMLLNIHTGQWDDEILGILELPRRILPEIRDSAGRYGDTDPNEFLGICAPITGAIADQQAALFGQACFDAGNVKTTYGTGCFMLMNTGEKPVYSRGGLLTTVAWGFDKKLTFALDGGIYIAGAAVHWLRDKLGLIHSADEAEPLARSAKTNGGVYFVPAFSGLAAPHWDQYARGAIVGLNAGSAKEHLVRATLESVAYQVKENLDSMNTDSNIPIVSMRVDGGMVLNSFLMQFQADILGIPVDIPVITDTTALGAACLAAYGLGEVQDFRELSAPGRIAKSFEPEMSADERENLMSGWRKAVERAKNWAE